MAKSHKCEGWRRPVNLPISRPHLEDWLYPVSRAGYALAGMPMAKTVCGPSPFRSSEAPRWMNLRTAEFVACRDTSNWRKS